MVGKLEREMTKEQVDAICKVCDSVWICRGDMGVQMGFVGMTKFVREFTKKYIPNLKVPCIIAGEVMEHLCEHPAPTRTEICYLANCIIDGYKGMVLSDETVFGKYFFVIIILMNFANHITLFVIELFIIQIINILKILL